MVAKKPNEKIDKQAEAESIIEEAKAKADEILEEARKQSDKLLKEAREKRETRVVEDKNDYALVDERSDSIVIHCSDSRFQNAFRTFINEELKLKSYAPLVVPGASQLLMFSDLLPKFSTAFLRSLKFMIKEQNMKRVFVIMHEDCVWYHRFVPAFLDFKNSVKERQIQDLIATRRLLEGEFTDVEVRIFYAAMIPGKKVGFTEILDK